MVIMMCFKVLGYTMLSHCRLHFWTFAGCSSVRPRPNSYDTQVFCALKSILREILPVNSKSPKQKGKVFQNQDVCIVDPVNNGILWTVASVKVNWLVSCQIHQNVKTTFEEQLARCSTQFLTDPRLSSSETLKEQLQWSLLIINKTLFQCWITLRI